MPQSGEPVYVGEGQIVRMYTASGKFIRAWKNGPAGPFSWPSVAAAPGGVIVGNGPDHPSVMRFAADESSLSASDWFTPKPQDDPGWFRGVSALHAAEFQGAGQAVVMLDGGSDGTNFNNTKVHAFTFGGTSLGYLLPPPGSPVNSVGRGTGITASGSLLFMSELEGRVVAYSVAFQDGQLKVTNAYELAMAGRPLGLASAPSGFWVLLDRDSGGQVAQRWSFSPGGSGLQEQITQNDAPGGFGGLAIAADASGNVFIADQGHGGRILKFGPGGAPPEFGGGPSSPALNDCPQQPAPPPLVPLSPATPPFQATFSLPKKLDPLTSKKLSLIIKCTTACSVSMFATLVAGRTKVKLKPRSREKQTPGQMTLTLQVPKRAATIAKRRLRHKQSARFDVKLVVVDLASGKSASRSFKLPLKRIA